MSDEEPTLKNIAKEIVTRGYLHRARERQRSSKTIWDVIFLPIGFAAIGGYWYAFAKLSSGFIFFSTRPTLHAYKHLQTVR
jgi:hypothetical protein